MTHGQQNNIVALDGRGITTQQLHKMVERYYQQRAEREAADLEVRVRFTQLTSAENRARWARSRLI